MKDLDVVAGGGFVAALLVYLAVPLLYILGGLFVTGWFVVLGAHDAHAIVWGWLSHKHYDDHGVKHWTPNGQWFLLWTLSISSLYFLTVIGYMAWCGVAGAVRTLARKAAL